MKAPTRSNIDPDYPLVPVPRSARRNPASLFVLLLSFFFFTPTMLAGGQVSAGFRFLDFLHIALWAAVILAVYAGLMGVISARTGLSTVVITKICLGKVGGKWASLLLAGTQIGWFAVTLAVLADLIGRAIGVGVDWPLILLFGVLTATAAFKGTKGLELLGWVAVPMLLILCVWMAHRALTDVGGWQVLLDKPALEQISVGTALTILIGTFVSGATQVGNWSRFSRRAGECLAVILLAILIAQSSMYFFGGLGSAAYGEPDFVVALFEMGLIFAGASLLLLALWTTNENTAYAFGVAGAELFSVNNKKPFVAGGALIAIVLAVTGIYDSLETFLVLLGTLVPPLGGAVMGQFYLVWRARLPEGTVHETEGVTHVPTVRLSGLLAYLCGTVAAGVGTAMEIGIPAVQGILVAAFAAPVIHFLSTATKHAKDKG